MGLEPGLDFHTVQFSDGSVLRSHAIILATGGNPRKLNIPGEEEFYGKGVSYCAVCDGFFFRDKTVVVIGGGDTAAEESLYLAKLVKQVYIVHRRDALRAGALLQQRVKAECKIEILWNSVPPPSKQMIVVSGQWILRIPRPVSSGSLPLMAFLFSSGLIPATNWFRPAQT